MKIPLLLALFFTPFLAGCQDNQPVRKSITEEDLIRVNRQMVNRDADRIKEYIKNNNLSMQETKTGLWYSVLETGDTVKARKGNLISLKYTLSLLDGTTCYSSDSLGIKTFLIGQGGVESGLEEAVLLLGKGAKAKFILPPHLGHGLIGDDNQIPARAILIYDIEVMDIK